MRGSNVAAKRHTHESIKDVIKATRGPLVMLDPHDAKIILMYFWPGNDVVSESRLSVVILF